MSRGLARQSAGVLLSTVVASALALAFLLMVAHIAGVSARGGLAFLVAVPSLASFAATMGLETANLHFAARDEAARPALARASIVRGSAWGSTLAAAAGAALAAAPGLAPDVLPGWSVALALVATPLMCVQFLLISLLTGSGDVGPANVVRAAIPAVSLISFAALAAAGRGDVGGAAAAWFTGQAFGAVGALWAARARIGSPALGGRDRVPKEVTSYGLRAHAGNLADLATFRIDTLVLASWWGARELGIYAAAVNVAEVVLYLPTAVATVLLPHRSAPGAEGSSTLRTLAVVGAAATAAAVAGAVAAPWLVGLLYPAEFSAAATPLRILFAAMVGTSVRRVLAAELAAVRRQGIASIVAIATFATVLALDLALIPQDGAVGAAWASAGGYLLGGALMAVAAARRRAS